MSAAAGTDLHLRYGPVGALDLSGCSAAAGEAPLRFKTPFSLTLKVTNQGLSVIHLQ